MARWESYFKGGNDRCETMLFQLIAAQPIRAWRTPKYCPHAILCAQMNSSYGDPKKHTSMVTRHPCIADQAKRTPSGPSPLPPSFSVTGLSRKAPMVAACVLDDACQATAAGRRHRQSLCRPPMFQGTLDQRPGCGLATAVGNQRHPCRVRWAPQGPT